MVSSRFRSLLLYQLIDAVDVAACGNFSLTARSVSSFVAPALIAFSATRLTWNRSWRIHFYRGSRWVQAAGLDRATPGTRVGLTGVLGRQSRPSRRLPSHLDRPLRQVALVTPLSAPNRLGLDRPLDQPPAKPRNQRRIAAA